ncbi:MAG: hypothetical protein GY716_18945 [bacterium]|nr:hypothetical protein [bacterium]
MSQPSKRACIVVPLSNRPGFTDDELISLRHLEHHLGAHDRAFVVPPGLEVDRPGFRIERFDDRFFGSQTAHRDLLFSPTFYRRFADYEFMLIYHLDALVFGDRLDEWCDRGFDYVGPPWIEHEDAPYHGNPAYEGKVGNAGFSLRRIEAFLRVVESRRFAVEPGEYWRRLREEHPAWRVPLLWPKSVLMRSSRFNNAQWEMARYSYASEERFVANRASHYYPEFNIADVETALSFGFECVPRYCYERNGNRLPFGCHAWQRYDREFWEPFLLGAPEDALP